MILGSFLINGERMRQRHRHKRKAQGRGDPSGGDLALFHAHELVEGGQDEEVEGDERGGRVTGEGEDEFSFAFLLLS